MGPRALPTSTPSDYSVPTVCHAASQHYSHTAAPNAAQTTSNLHGAHPQTALAIDGCYYKLSTIAV